MRFGSPGAELPAAQRAMRDATAIGTRGVAGRLAGLDRAKAHSRDDACRGLGCTHRPCAVGVAAAARWLARPSHHHGCRPDCGCGVRARV